MAGLAEALEGDFLDKGSLALINSYQVHLHLCLVSNRLLSIINTSCRLINLNDFVFFGNQPNLSGAWLLQRAMSVRIGRNPQPDFINRLLTVNFQSMQVTYFLISATVGTFRRPICLCTSMSSGLSGTRGLFLQRLGEPVIRPFLQVSFRAYPNKLRYARLLPHEVAILVLHAGCHTVLGIGQSDGVYDVDEAPNFAGNHF